MDSVTSGGGLYLVIKSLTGGGLGTSHAIDYSVAGLTE